MIDVTRDADHPPVAPSSAVAHPSVAASSSSRQRVLVLGEALTDIVIRPGESSEEYAGGSPLNVAVALGRLGHDAHLMTQVGVDERGRAIVQHLEDSGVSLTPGSCRADTLTSTAEATIGPDGAASYRFDIQWDPDARDLPEDVAVVHCASLGASLAPGADVVRDIVERYRGSAVISYDPNVRPSLMGQAREARALVHDIVRRAHVVKASDEDVQWLYSDDPQMRGIDDVARAWVRDGVALAVITRGSSGASAFTASGRIDVPGVRVEVADTVGAGDTFSAGLIDALAREGILGGSGAEHLERLESAQVRRIVEHAARLAAVTVSRAGANPPWAHEL